MGGEFEEEGGEDSVAGELLKELASGKDASEDATTEDDKGITDNPDA